MASTSNSKLYICNKLQDCEHKEECEHARFHPFVMIGWSNCTNQYGDCGGICKEAVMWDK